VVATVGLQGTPGQIACAPRSISRGTSVEILFAQETVRHILDAIRAWAQANRFVSYSSIQALVLLGCISVGFALAPVVRRRVAYRRGNIPILRLRALHLRSAGELVKALRELQTAAWFFTAPAR